MCNMNCKCGCTLWAIVVSVILGIIAAFLQITGVITVGTSFLWIVLGVAIAYLAILLLAVSVYQRENGACECICEAIGLLIVAILGSVLFSAILLAIGGVAAGAVGAILVGLLIAFFFLTLSSTGCLVKCIADCD